MFRCSRTFSAGTTKKIIFHLLSNRIFRKRFVNGKQPLQISAPVPTQAEGSAVNGRCTLCYYLTFLFYLAYFYQKITDQITI